MKDPKQKMLKAIIDHHKKYISAEDTSQACADIADEQTKLAMEWASKNDYIFNHPTGNWIEVVNDELGSTTLRVAENTEQLLQKFKEETEK